MEYRKLGRTGVEVSSLCLGTMMFGGKADLNDATAILKTFVDAGGNLLDTANVYGKGASETTLGQAIRDLGLDRDELVIASKCHGRMKDGEHQPNRFGNSRRMIIEECDASLKRLGTDYIDLYQIHRPQSTVPIDETLRALDDLVRAGKVRYLGASTFAAWQLVESLWVSDRLGLNRFVTEQPPYHLLDRRIEREFLPMCQTYGFAVLPWSPLAGGFLTGKYRRNQAAPADARLQPDHWRTEGTIDNEAAFGIIDTLETIAQRHQKTISQVSLAWVRDRPGVTAPILGPRTNDQLTDNLGAIDLTLSEEDLADLDRAAPPGRAIKPYYNADFGPNARW